MPAPTPGRTGWVVETADGRVVDCGARAGACVIGATTVLDGREVPGAGTWSAPIAFD